MSRPVSLPWLNALARAWPLRSPRAFEQALGVLLPDTPGSPSAIVRSELIEELRRNGRGLSLDVLELAVEAAWFAAPPPGPRRGVALIDHLLHFANDLL